MITTSTCSSRCPYEAITIVVDLLSHQHIASHQLVVLMMYESNWSKFAVSPCISLSCSTRLHQSWTRGGGGAVGPCGRGGGGKRRRGRLEI
eukprot:762178-Hanusia_phi.AAC.1